MRSLTLSTFSTLLQKQIIYLLGFFIFLHDLWKPNNNM